MDNTIWNAQVVLLTTHVIGNLYRSELKKNYGKSYFRFYDGADILYIQTLHIFFRYSKFDQKQTIDSKLMKCVHKTNLNPNVLPFSLESRMVMKC
jgi:hypothetical protein